jgi:formylmethanofuran dehydrogenase subunit E
MDSRLISYRSIGTVESPFKVPAPPDTMKETVSSIIIDENLVEGLTGLHAGDKILVVFSFHESEGYNLLQHPRGDSSQPRRGVFSLRSPRRPNPIGITEVDLLNIDGNTLTVRGLDAIHGTPILDLKLV